MADEETPLESAETRTQARKSSEARVLAYQASLEARAEEPGYFSIYKKGQGYWTRMGTAGAAALIGVLTANFLYAWLPVWLSPIATPETAFRIAVGVAAGFLIVYAFIIFKVMNRPSNADFLIATDSEMKKVNWATRRELVGSTRVVILFMFFLATILFVVDLIFMTFFWWIRVLHIHPFFQS